MGSLIKLPLYPLRSYLSKTEDNGVVVLETVYARYVLDDKNLIGDFADRRLQMVENKDKYKYPIYRLPRKVNTLSQLLNSKVKVFIDEKGNILKHKKEQYYRIVLKRVISSSQIFNGKYHNYVAGCAHPFITKEPYEYLSLAIVDNSFILFDVHHHRPLKVRSRVKI